MKIGDKVKGEILEPYHKNGVFYEKGQILPLVCFGSNWFKHYRSWNESHPNQIPAKIVKVVA